jgi:UDP-N-acetylglucosamine 2-epimerase (non-hydrolysing)
MILLCYGTRPEWIKIKPLITEMKKKKISFKVLFTGQQKDIAKENSADYIYSIQDSSINRLDTIIIGCLSMPEYFFNGVKRVLVQGDTATAFGLALAAFHRKLEVIHLEAGLRTHDKNNPYPEETYRQMISRIADLNLCPTTLNVQNLMNESVDGSIAKVGNTIIDNLSEDYIESKETNLVLVTLHRRENHDIMQKWFEEINKLAVENPDLNFILPIHPNPNVKKYRDVLTKVNVVDPIPHEELIKMIAASKLIITDSGGIQEEGSFFNKKVIVCRKVTERPESLTLTSFLCPDPKELSNLFNTILNMKIANHECPYGDGRASQQIVELLQYV